MTQRDIFTAALQITDPDERAAYPTQACGGDTELRRRVEILLRTHEAAGNFLARPAVEDLTGDPSLPDAEQWENSVAGLPAEKQVEAVARRRQKLSHGFDGRVIPTIEHGVLRGLASSTADVDDLSPLRGAPEA
jgi:hypothetical protein